MGQQQSAPPHSSRVYRVQPPQRQQRLEHEGILRLRPTPFPNCVELATEGALLFLENAQTTLQELLESRLYTNRLFPLEDIQRLIQNVVYTLAYMGEAGVVYRDLCAQNIYYADGQFKLLPNQLIEQSFYDRAWDAFYGLRKGDSEDTLPYLSPQLIIALRMKSKSVDDLDILSKSCVFILGLILLEVTTLLPSSECFDSTNYDIFNNIVSERLEMVEDHYNQCIARIIGNMIDYDFDERMDLKDLAIWVNRELTSGKTEPNSLDNSVDERQKNVARTSKAQTTTNKSRLVYESQRNPQKQIPDEKQDIPSAAIRTSYSKSNTVYINGYDDGTGLEQNPYVSEQIKGGARNSIYLASPNLYQQEQEMQKTTITRKEVERPKPQHEYGQRRTNQYDKYTKTSTRGRFNQNKDDSLEQPQTSNRTQVYTRAGTRVDYSPYRPRETTDKLRDIANMRARPGISDMPLKKNYDLGDTTPSDNIRARPKVAENRYYPSLNEIQNTEQYQDNNKKVVKHSEASKTIPMGKEAYESKQSRQSDSKQSVNDGSINRIKMEIEKSRKLIQEFRRSEGISP